MDRGAASVPYLLAQYLFRHAEGRKSSARLSGRHLLGVLLITLVCLGHGEAASCWAAASGVAKDAPDVDEGRIEEEIQGLRQDVRSLLGLVNRSMTDQGRFSTWMVSCMTQLMKASGHTYQAFDGTL
ncbi:hypothetical protein Tco_0140982 [Tanacetum coccineum]